MADEGRADEGRMDEGIGNSEIRGKRKLQKTKETFSIALSSLSLEGRVSLANVFLLVDR